MRLYDIAFALFIFNLVLGYFSEIHNSLGLQETYEKMGEEERTIQEAQREMEEAIENTGINPEGNWFVENVKLVVKSIGPIMKAFANATILLPAMLQLYFGIPSSFAMILGLGVNFLYFMGILQWISGRSTKEVE